MSITTVDSIVIDSLKILQTKLQAATVGDALSIADKINELSKTYYAVDRKGQPLNVSPVVNTELPIVKLPQKPLVQDPEPETVSVVPEHWRNPEPAVAKNPPHRPRTESKKGDNENDPNPYQWKPWRRDDLGAFGCVGRVHIDLRSNCSYRKFAGYKVRVLGSKLVTSKTDPRFDLQCVVAEGFLKGQVFEMNLVHYNSEDGVKIPGRGEANRMVKAKSPNPAVAHDHKEPEKKTTKAGENPGFEWEGDFDEHPWIGMDFCLANPFGCDVDVQKAVGAIVTVCEVLPHKHPIHKTQIRAEIMSATDSRLDGKEVWVNPDNLLVVERD